MTMTTPAGPVPSTEIRSDKNLFPVLPPELLSRAEGLGRKRSVAPGEVLLDVGEQAVRFFIVIRGRLEAIRPTPTGQDFVSELGPGQFSGEVSTLAGQPALVRLHALDPSEVIEIDRDRLLTVVQTDPELSDILMRSFVLRRVELVARGLGDAVLMGSNHCADTLRIREFLTRN